MFREAVHVVYVYARQNDKKKEMFQDCQINILVSSNDATVASGFHSHPEDATCSRRGVMTAVSFQSGEVRVVAEMQQKRCS